MGDAIDWAASADALAADGVVHLPGALDAAAVAEVEAAFAWSLANPSPKAVRFDAKEEATFFEDTGSSHLELPRDEAGAQEGNDAALAPLYGGLQHGDPFHRALGPPI